MTSILGISAFYHDSAAALLVDGEIVAAAQEERFTRRKHDFDFPQHAVDYCLAEAGMEPEELSYVVFYDKPLTKFERLLETYLAYVPRGYRSFRQAMPLWLKQKLHLPRELGRGLHGRYAGRYIFTDHHESHAASAFFPSPFDQAAILTLDGVGEWSTSCIGVGRDNRIELLQELRFPHSLGLLYSAFTYYTGFRVNSGEYKLMGLAPYGQPTYKQLILGRLLDLKDDGSFRLDMSYFNYCQGLTMTSPKFHKLFGGPPRRPETEVGQRDMDLAASIQAVTEEVVLRIARHAHAMTRLNRVVLAGGVALNCVANGRLLREGPFEELWIQPAAGDAGGSLGAALFVWHQLLDQPRNVAKHDTQKGSLLGPAYADQPIMDILDAHQAEYHTCVNDEELCTQVAELIDRQQVVGWFQGRMEFGPRALGNRSILGDARSAQMQSVMNLKIKFRESFRPFAPIVLREYADQYFELRPNQDSPYMMIVAPVAEAIRTPPDAEYNQSLYNQSLYNQSLYNQSLYNQPLGLAQLNHRRSSLPAITHVDYSARIQTVDRLRNPLLHNLLTKFHQRTGCPVMINTSFNVRSEPIVCTPEDAYRCFLATDMDALVLGRQLLFKSDQQRRISEGNRARHLAKFQLD